MRFSMTVQQREAKESAEKQSKANLHRVNLQQQIDNRAAVKKKSQMVKYEEGQNLKDEFGAERAKLGAIRDKMVDDLLKKGINPQYLSEMRACDIEKNPNA